MIPSPGDGVELVFLQATPFCNLDCRYCYLPGRGDRSRMSLDTLRDSMRFIKRLGSATDSWCLVWHVGEPLVVEIDWYRRAHQLCAEELAPSPIEFHFQTNATLLTPEWVRFLQSDPSLHIGVSVDGPAWMHDAHRVTRSRKGTHARVMEGIRHLKEAGVPFDCIAVVTEQALDHPDEFFEFFVELDPRLVGLNAESVDGVNSSSTVFGGGTEDRYRRFLRRIADLYVANRSFVIRNFLWAELRLRKEQTEGTSQLPRAQIETNRLVRPWSIVSIDWKGRVHTFAPSLLGMELPQVGTHLGTVWNDPAELSLAPGFTWLSREIDRGIEKCRQECLHFSQCRGGSPSHKWFEENSFAVSETTHCRLGVQADWEEYLAAAEEYALQ